MNEILHIWDIIIKSNLFNFIVMVAILWWICKKFSIGTMLENAKQNVINSIEKSKEEKASSKEKLALANELVKNLDSDIASQLEEAGKQGDLLGNDIVHDTDSKISYINENISRVLESEEKTISSRLTGKTAYAAVQTAENHIKNILKNTPELHDRYIQESIDELDRIQV